MFYAKRLEKLRKDNRLTQQKMADLLHMQREVYRRYEKGNRQLPLHVAIEVSDLFEISLDYLTEREDREYLNTPIPVPGAAHIPEIEEEPLY